MQVSSGKRINSAVTGSCMRVVGQDLKINPHAYGAQGDLHRLRGQKNNASYLHVDGFADKPQKSATTGLLGVAGNKPISDMCRKCQG